MHTGLGSDEVAILRQTALPEYSSTKAGNERSRSVPVNRPGEPKFMKQRREQVTFEHTGYDYSSEISPIVRQTSTPAPGRDSRYSLRAIDSNVPPFQLGD